MTKAEKIRQTRQETLERRTQPQAFVVEAKLCPYSLSADLPARRAQAGMRQALKGLSASKRNGRKVGRLKFKREVRCLTLPQHGVTYKFVGKEKVKIAGIRKPLRVRGLSRIPEGAEVCCARLLKKPSGY
jgi:hypothetical protein